MKTMTDNAYTSMRQRHRQEVETFPMAFAFGENRLSEILAEWGVSREDVCSVYGAGDIIRKKDKADYLAMCERHVQEVRDAVAEDKTGKGFILDMFLSEMDAHEFLWTENMDDVLAAIPFTRDEISGSEAMRNGLMLARLHELRAAKSSWCA